MHLSDDERFDSYVLRGPRENSCWIWLGAVSDDGYSRFWIKTPQGQRAVSAHRFALALVHGGLDSIKGAQSLHDCDVPLCVRASDDPSTHLLLGTKSDNMLDQVRKGRLPSATAIKWRHLTRAKRAGQSRRLRHELKSHGWQEDIIRQPMYGIDPNHPTRSVTSRLQAVPRFVAGTGTF